jgi:hypothetical protein
MGGASSAGDAGIEEKSTGAVSRETTSELNIHSGSPKLVFHVKHSIFRPLLQEATRGKAIGSFCKFACTIWALRLAQNYGGLAIIKLNYDS